MLEGKTFNFNKTFATITKDDFCKISFKYSKILQGD